MGYGTSAKILMIMNVGKTFWWPLGCIAVILGCAALVYAVVSGIHDRDEPLIGVFIAMVAIPATLPAFFGYFMMQGKAWAAWTLRLSIVGMLLCGAVLDFAMGLDVFSLPQLAIPLIIGSIIWLILSLF